MGNHMYQPIGSHAEHRLNFLKSCYSPWLQNHRTTFPIGAGQQQMQLKGFMGWRLCTGINGLTLATHNMCAKQICQFVTRYCTCNKNEIDALWN